MYIGVIFNPHARKNIAAPGRSRELQNILGKYGEVHETHSAEDVKRVLGELLPRITHLVSDGGDGSLNWLVNDTEHCIADPHDWPTFVPSMGGSVNAVGRKAGVKGRPKEILRELAIAAQADRPPPEMRLDTLTLDGETKDGEKFHRLCFGLAAGGVGNRFYDRYYDNHTHGRADVVKVIARSTRDYLNNKFSPGHEPAAPNYATKLFIPTQARVIIDGDEVPTREHRFLHAGAIDLVIGGGFRLFPKASEPGLLHFQAGNLRPSRIITQLPRALRTGKIHGGFELRDVNGREMIIEAEEEPLSPIVDGERFFDIVKLTARAGPLIRVARVEPSVAALA
jgi:hypothetical protein